MAFHSVPLSYQPKLDAVFDGRCRQTIRMGRRYRPGDEVLFFEWTGRPYRSKWGRRRRVTLTSALPITLRDDSYVLHVTDRARSALPALPVSWSWPEADGLASRDWIDPPTGEELRRVLESFHGPFPRGGMVGQVLGW